MRPPAPSTAAFKSTRLSTLAAVALAALVLLVGLGHRALTDWDEGIYAEIAREMLATHTLQGFLIPHWNGAVWFEKPPLQMWLTAGFLRLLGLNAFAARLPSALAGIAAVGLLHSWLQRRFNVATAWCGTVLLLSAFGFQHVARVGETDTLLSLFCLLATLGLAELLFGNDRGWLLFWTGFALALMTKGAASLTVPLSAVALLATQPRAVLRFRRTFWTGVAVFALLTLPWHLFAYLRFRGAFVAPYLGLHVVQRASSALEGHVTRGWFYLWVLLVSAPLFSLLYPAGVVSPWRDRSLAPLRPLSLFAGLELLLFSVVRTRLPHYIAPAYPAFAAVTGAWLATLFARRGSPASAGGQALLRRMAVPLVAVALFALAAALTERPRRQLHAPLLRNGYSTPDNREAVALLQHLQNAPLPVPGGPLLVWRSTPVVPVTTDAFYARRLVKQVSLVPAPADLPLDPYFNAPAPLQDFLGSAHLVLLDRSLADEVPAGAVLLPLWTGPTLEVAVLQPAPPAAGRGPDARSGEDGDAAKAVHFGHMGVPVALGKH